VDVSEPGVCASTHVCVCRYGFAAIWIEADKKWNGIPRVLDLSQLSVYVRRDITNETDYQYQVPLREGKMRVPMDKDGFLRGIITVELDPPTLDGSLNSKVSAAIRLLLVSKQMLAFATRTSRRMADPTIYLQRDDPQKHDAAMVLNNVGPVGKS